MDYINTSLGDVVSDSESEKAPLWEVLTEFKENLIGSGDDTCSIQDAIDWLEEAYPESDWSPKSIRAHFRMMSTNNGNRVDNWPIREDHNVFFSLGGGKYRPY
ncbi:MAG: hypothetical protein VX320_06265, partial [Candidatus Thermoplasmatota archaeon]|nr:hypothetical protein [Candidatus Thermoplasmatota archaeon]